jgi:hypothetical protein
MCDAIVVVKFLLGLFFSALFVWIFLKEYDLLIQFSNWVIGRIWRCRSTGKDASLRNSR